MKINNDVQFWSDGYLEILLDDGLLSVFKGTKEICCLETNDRKLVRHILDYYDVQNTAVKIRNNHGGCAIIVLHKGNKYSLWIAPYALWITHEEQRITFNQLNAALAYHGFPEWRPKDDKSRSSTKNCVRSHRC